MGVPADRQVEREEVVCLCHLTGREGDFHHLESSLLVLGILEQLMFCFSCSPTSFQVELTFQLHRSKLSKTSTTQGKMNTTSKTCVSPIRHNLYNTVNSVLYTKPQTDTTSTLTTVTQRKVLKSSSTLLTHFMNTLCHIDTPLKYT